MESTFTIHSLFWGSFSLVIFRTGTKTTRFIAIPFAAISIGLCLANIIINNPEQESGILKLLVFFLLTLTIQYGTGKRIFASNSEYIPIVRKHKESLKILFPNLANKEVTTKEINHLRITEILGFVFVNYFWLMVLGFAFHENFTLGTLLLGILAIVDIIDSFTSKPEPSSLSNFFFYSALVSFSVAFVSFILLQTTKSKYDKLFRILFIVGFVVSIISGIVSFLTPHLS